MGAPHAVDAAARFRSLVHRQLTLSELLVAADDAVRRLIEIDLSCWFSCDPATMMPTSHYAPEMGLSHIHDLAANEFLEDDVNKFADLARAKPPVATLLDATEGDPRRSPRFVSVLEPSGFGSGDELRAVFLRDGLAWGAVALHRHGSRFTPRDIDVVAEIGPLVAEGIRRAVRAQGPAAERGLEAPGLVLLGPGNQIQSMTATARRHLDSIVDLTAVGSGTGLPLGVMSVADVARLAVAGQSQELANLRIPVRDGGWLLVHAAVLDGEPAGRVAVTLTPARQPEVAAMILDSYGLSRRERDVAGLVLRGMSTTEIAGALHLSAYTVQDHLKSVFDKAGVRSRRDFVAQVFFEHYAPGMAAGAVVGSDGWFAPAAR